ncbi:MAG: hypothetical protein PHT19_01235 [Methylococcus sp.]|nr:hypothetical protein [Methylococcus sp.]
MDRSFFSYGSQGRWMLLLSSIVLLGLLTTAAELRESGGIQL